MKAPMTPVGATCGLGAARSMMTSAGGGRNGHSRYHDVKLSPCLLITPSSATSLIWPIDEVSNAASFDTAAPPHKRRACQPEGLRSRARRPAVHGTRLGQLFIMR